MLQSHSCRLTHAPHRSSANCHCSVLLWTTILRENAWNQKWPAVQTYKDTSPVLVAQVAVEPHDPVDLALVPFRWVLIALGKGHRGRDRNVDATQLCNAQRWPQFHQADIAGISYLDRVRQGAVAVQAPAETGRIRVGDVARPAAVKLPAALVVALLAADLARRGDLVDTASNLAARIVLGASVATVRALELVAIGARERRPPARLGVLSGKAHLSHTRRRGSTLRTKSARHGA